MLITFFLGAFVLVLLMRAPMWPHCCSRAAPRGNAKLPAVIVGAPRVRLVRMLVTESLLLA